MGKPVPATVLDSGGGLYAAEAKVYPREIRGHYDSLRRLAVVVLLGMYYGFPWLHWDGHQAVLFDLPARKFYVFGLVFWPQDFIYLALLLIIAGIALFFFPTVAGRLWCGYACPQTVWTEVFLWIEHWTEGDRAKRIKLDNGPWTPEKWRRKGAKHFLWLVFALWTGFTFVGFFTPINELAARAVPFAWSGWESFWVLFYALATWGNAGVLREQVCKYMCPYARFQGAMFDRETLIIAYDPMRGEPRGSRKRSVTSVLARMRGLLSLEAAERWMSIAQLHPSAADRQVDARRSNALVGAARSAIELAQPVTLHDPLALGDCIDCTLCVQVCPTGIDIRNGLQYECIGCGACIDACDQVMDKMAYPRGLIRYTTQNALEGMPSRVLRPRVWIYGLLLIALLGGWGWGVTHRAPFLVEVLRDRNALYRQRAGYIENVYTLKLVNKVDAPRDFRIWLEHAGAVSLVGKEVRAQAEAGSVQSVALTLRAKAGAVRGRSELRLVIEASDPPQHRTTLNTTFFGPP